MTTRDEARASRAEFYRDRADQRPLNSRQRFSDYVSAAPARVERAPRDLTMLRLRLANEASG